jgi:DNA-binding beta-propeller fold protein YncE
MQSYSKTAVVAAVAAMIAASSAQAGGLKKVGDITLPDDPMTDIGIMAIDPATGLGYLADKTNKSVVVFDTKTDKFVSRIPGFMGRTKDGDLAGPNGVTVVKGEVWASDGDSTIKLIDIKTGKVTETISTGGKKRANGLAYAENIGVVIVANSNDDPPYLSFISTEPGHKILAKIAIPESGENLERSVYHEPSGMFYTAIPVSKADPTKGLMAQTDPKTGKLVKLHELGCHPHSLSLASDATIFLGCSSVHGPNPKPGGDMAIFDIASGKVESYLEGYGGNGGSTTNPNIGHYYHSSSGGMLIVVDTKTKQGLQKIPTSNGARSAAVNLDTNRLYLATTAKDLPCRGCISIYAAE